MNGPTGGEARRWPRFFDAHCDTVMRAFDPGLDFLAGDARGHLDLPRLLAAGSCGQLFAVFAAHSYFPDRDLRGYAERAIAIIRGWIAGSAGRMRLVLTASDLRQMMSCGASKGGTPASPDTEGATAEDPVPMGDQAVWALIGLEGADPLEGRAENLEHFYRLGVRNVIPAWDDNPFSGSATGSGGPLTAEGIRLIELAEELGVMVDVSHLSDQAFAQICQIARRPFIASHSNCRALCPSPRNLSDDMIRSLAERGGVMGINLAPDFLSPTYLAAWDAVMAPFAHADPATRRQARQRVQAELRAIPLPGVEWVARHVRHAIAVGGEDCVGLGGDLDGISFMPAGMTGIESYPLIAEALQAAGLSAAQVEKVCWRNMARVFLEVLR
jgi:membrane dipeptidase